MHKLLKILLVIQICISIISCEHKSGTDEDHFEGLVVQYNFQAKKYELVNKKIYSLDKPRSLNSNIAKFFYKVEADVDLDYETPVQLNLIKTSDDLYVAKDVSSLKSISSYKIYEDYYDLNKKLGILTYSTWPKKVVIDGVDGKNTNNAFHFPSRTSTFYLPFDPNDVPASLNPGVIAHEESHGLFYNQVVEDSNISDSLYMANSELLKINHRTSVKCLRKLTCGNLKSLYKNTKVESQIGLEIFATTLDNMEHNHTVLKALDEGFADYAGYVFTKVPNFLSATLGYESESGRFNRVVGSSLNEPLPSVDQLQAIIDGVKGKSNVHSSSLPPSYKMLSRSTSELLTLSYRMAGQVSSLLNMLSKNIDYADMPSNLTKEEYFLKLVTKSLSNMKKVLFAKYTSEKISFDDFFKSVLDVKIVTSNTCSILADNISDDITVEGCVK